MLTLGPALAAGQSTLERTPNLTGGWTGDAGQAYFHFLHRFQRTDAPARKVTSSPTFLLGYAPFSSLLAGVHYATSSTVAPSYPNEWEVFARWSPLPAAVPVEVSVQGGYNDAARSADGALDVARTFGPVRALGTVRAFSDAYGSGEGLVAAGGGALVRLGPVALGADVARVLDGSHDTAWGAALQWRIPLTPHSLSLQVSNAMTGTLQGASRGSGRTLYGFEFTIPVTLARYFGSRGGGATEAAAAAPAAPGAAPAAVAPVSGRDTVTIVIRNLSYGQRSVAVAAGTLVRWVNEDQVEHTVTHDRGAWDSGLIRAGGGVFQRVFSEPGEYPYTCTPHPFMKAVIVVKSRGGDA
ncbi:MAG TPA: plastocyanin/azurin family copper-binding protein [Longimicrobiales bacterium]|nr:plastocyanin/azurin family copper-binding protein [Longimicrobiales bacterium]